MKKASVFLLATFLSFGCAPTHDNSATIQHVQPTISTYTKEDQYKDYKKAGGELSFFEWQVIVLGEDPNHHCSANHFIVYFLDGDNNIITYSVVNPGEPAFYDGKMPTKSEVNDNGKVTRFIFSKWDQDFTNVTKNMVIHALFETDPKEYFEAKFVDYDDRVISSAVLPYGSIPEAPKSPEREQSVNGHRYTDYEFAGWDKPLDAITKPTTFKATYKETIWEGYRVTWKAPDGAVLLTGVYKKGSNPRFEHDGDPEPYYFDDNYNYIFESWDKTVENLCSDTIVTEKAMRIPRIDSGDMEPDPDNDDKYEVTDKKLIGILESYANSYNLGSGGIVEYNGKRYTIFRSLQNNGEEEYIFIERIPLKWHLLKKEEGKLLAISSNRMYYRLLFSNDRVDFIYLNNYYNNEFLNEHFSKNARIEEIEIDNSLHSRMLDSSYTVEPNASGKIFLLSLKEYHDLIENDELFKALISQHGFVTRSYSEAGLSYFWINEKFETCHGFNGMPKGSCYPALWFQLD